MKIMAALRVLQKCDVCIMYMFLLHTIWLYYRYVDQWCTWYAINKTNEWILVYCLLRSLQTWIDCIAYIYTSCTYLYDAWCSSTITYYRMNESIESLEFIEQRLLLCPVRCAGRVETINTMHFFSYKIGMTLL